MNTYEKISHRWHGLSRSWRISIKTHESNRYQFQNELVCASTPAANYDFPVVILITSDWTSNMQHAWNKNWHQNSKNIGFYLNLSRDRWLLKYIVFSGSFLTRPSAQLWPKEPWSLQAWQWPTSSTDTAWRYPNCWWVMTNIFPYLTISNCIQFSRFDTLIVPNLTLTLEFRRNTS